MLAWQTVLVKTIITSSLRLAAVKLFPGHVDNDINGDEDDVTMYYMNVHTFVVMCPDGSDTDHSDNE